MKQNRTLNWALGLSTVLALGLSASPASADFTISPHGGVSFNGGDVTGIKNPSLLLGGEATIGISDVLQVGGFYDYNSLSPSVGGTSGSLSFYGALGRLRFAPTGLFIDGRVGFTTSTFASISSDSAFGYGFGAGYQIDLAPMVSLKPRVGYRSVPTKFGTTSTSHTMIDLDLMIAFAI